MAAILGRLHAIPAETFWAELNSIHPKIQFTMEFSNKQLPFQDILVKLHEEDKYKNFL